MLCYMEFVGGNMVHLLKDLNLELIIIGIDISPDLRGVRNNVKMTRTWRKD